jgi:hypothetical protein
MFNLRGNKLLDKACSDWVMETDVVGDDVVFVVIVEKVTCIVGVLPFRC